MFTQGPQQGLLTDRCEECRCLLQFCHNRVFGGRVRESVLDHIRREKETTIEEMQAFFVASYKSIVDSAPYSEVLNCNLPESRHPPLCMWNGVYLECMKVLEHTN